MQKALWPADRNAFRDKYLAASMVCLALLFFKSSSAQYDSTKQRQIVSGYGFEWKNGKFGTLVLPTDTVKMAVKDSGALAYKAGQLWKWTGYLWTQTIGSGGGSGFSVRQLASSSFSALTNCPLPALNNDSLQVFWNDLNRFLNEGTEWQALAGGGFKILVPGFDASVNNYSLTVYANNIASPPGPVSFTSSNFSTSVNCPISAYNGMTLQIFWNDAQRYLSAFEWMPLAGGGFIITMPGFDASATNYSFYVFAQ